jgi:hypothetical protein
MANTVAGKIEFCTPDPQGFNPFGGEPDFRKGRCIMVSSKPLDDWTKRAECEGILSEFASLAQLAGMSLHRVQYSDADVARFAAPGGRLKLEKIAREHLGTAAIAILQGAVCR